jgi:hypothetical protein
MMAEAGGSGQADKERATVVYQEEERKSIVED